MRLIDADKLIKRFKELKGIDSLSNMFVTDVINEIKKQPTAYDVDKVVEQLEELRGNELDGIRKGISDIELVQSIRGQNILNDAIGIVKSGGINKEKEAGE